MRDHIRFKAKFAEHGDKYCVLIFEVAEHDFDFAFRFDINLKVMFRTSVCFPPEYVLTHHDKGHEQNLDEIGNEEPEDKGARRIELQTLGCKQVPTKPEDSPDKDGDEETHGSNMAGNPEGQLVELADFLRDSLAYVSQRDSKLFNFVNRRWWS
jgi:hypothetical protein